MEQPLLIIANPDLSPRWATKDYSLDLAWGSSENNYTLTGSFSELLQQGWWWYFDNSPYAGRIDSIRPNVVNGDSTITYAGRTVSGLFEDKVLSPDTGKDYVTVEATQYEISKELIRRANLTEVIQPLDTGNSSIIQYQFDRYGQMWDRILQLCTAKQLRPVVQCVNNRIYFGLNQQQTLTNTLDSNLFDFKIESNLPYNHIVGAGQGDLDKRIITHLYADKQGNISKIPTFTGVEERTYYYDYTAADQQTLEDEATKKLQEFQQSQTTITVTMHDDTPANMWDRLTAADQITGMTVSATITKQILKASNGIATISVEAGNTSIQNKGEQ